MKSTSIDLGTWKRADDFKFFIDNLRCVIGITADIDVTDVLAFCKRKGYRFYPVFIHIVSSAVNRRDEFKVRYDDGGKLVLWEEVSPYYTVFSAEDERFTRLLTPYSKDFETFYKNVLDDMEVHKNAKGNQIKYTVPNSFDVSCLPWLNYKSFDLHVFDSGTCLSPLIMWGQYKEQAGRFLMPLTLQVHHAVADGFHVARFYKDVEERIGEFCGLM
ncbi:MAG: chloramphenicol acetyltransferase [Oscillospiraceae bacterium]|nr:chloramphenicol acetyltransferase [Oscillospiraceae bacterium]